MQATPRGPDFERSPDQKVIPGDYRGPKPRKLPEAPTLMDKLRYALANPGRRRRRGPGFRKPLGWRPWGNAKSTTGADKASPKRPTGYRTPMSNRDVEGA